MNSHSRNQMNDIIKYNKRINVRGAKTDIWQIKLYLF